MVHLYRAGAQWITVGLVVIGAAVWLLPGRPVGPFTATGLLKPAAWASFGPMAYADVLDVLIPWAAGGALLLLESDCRESQRSLTLAWPTETTAWMAGRALAVVSWGLGWTVAAAGIPALLAQPVDFGRDVMLVLPVVVFLTGVTFASTELFHDPWAGLLTAVIVSLLGLGIRHLPFADAKIGQLEVFDARNHLWGPGLVHNGWSLAGLGVMGFAMGWGALALHRRRGTYQS
jgi:hypothetical protein